MLELDVIVEIPKGSRNKYELDKVSGRIKFDRTLFSAMHYPTDYGYFDNSLGEDEDPLDALIMVWEPTFPGCMIKVRPIGVLLMADEKGIDHKVLCVPIADPLWNHLQNLAQVPPHLLKEIEYFFTRYKDLENKISTTQGWRNEQEAESIIQAAYSRYAKA